MFMIEWHMYQHHYFPTCHSTVRSSANSQLLYITHDNVICEACVLRTGRDSLAFFIKFRTTLSSLHSLAASIHIWQAPSAFETGGRGDVPPSSFMGDLDNIPVLHTQWTTFTRPGVSRKSWNRGWKPGKIIKRNLYFPI